MLHGLVCDRLFACCSQGAHSQMLPKFSSDLDSPVFDMCTAWGMCEGEKNVQKETGMFLASSVSPFVYHLLGNPMNQMAFGTQPIEVDQSEENIQNIVVAAMLDWRYQQVFESFFAMEPGLQYPSQTRAEELM
jgi:hypothetical protein